VTFVTGAKSDFSKWRRQRGRTELIPDAPGIQEFGGTGNVEARKH
jgi:hypothetical protein